MDDFASGTLSPEHEAVLEAEFGPEGRLSAFAGSDSFPEQFGHYRKQMMERTLERGAQLRDRGDVAGAIAAYQEVAACGDPQLVPHAAFELGRLQAPTGETGPADPDADPGEEDGSRR